MTNERRRYKDVTRVAGCELSLANGLSLPGSDPLLPLAGAPALSEPRGEYSENEEMDDNADTKMVMILKQKPCCDHHL